MRPDATRVAYRHLRGGLIEPPPAMVDTIYEWALAVHSATELDKLTGEIERQKTRNQEWQKSVEKEVLVALDAFKAQPTKWKPYKAAFEASVRWFGYGMVPSLKIKEFQKLDDDRRAELQERMLKIIEEAEDWVRRSVQNNADGIKEMEAETRKLESQTRSGVPAMPERGVLTHTFPVDLTGWKYEDMEGKIQKKLDLMKEDLLQRMPDATGDQRKVMEVILRGMKSRRKVITVALTKDLREPANWNESRQTMMVKLPPARDLVNSLKHELRHFSQGMMNEAVTGWGEQFLLRKPSPGLPSRHIMTPDIRQDQERAPDSLIQILKEQLESQHTPFHIQRALLHNPKIDLHALDDVEFYTRLADAIQEFQAHEKRVGRLSPKAKSQLIQMYTGSIESPFQGNMDHEMLKTMGGYDTARWFKPHKFFTTLKKYARGKWKKAVGELVKVVL